MLTLSPSTVTSPQGIDQKVTWNFASGVVNFDNLALAETLVLTYTLRAHDGALSGQQAVTVTIEGSNDAPVISVKSGDSASAALVEADAGLQTSDTLTFGDVDLTDQLTLSVVSVAATGIGNGSALPSATALLAMLEFDKLQALVGTGGVEEQVVWRFNSGTEAFNFLNPGETLSLAYTVQASDGRVSDQEVITIQIAGTADEVLRLISTSTGSRPAATPHTLITGESTSDRAGSGLIGIGDFNGDGIDDMVSVHREMFRVEQTEARPLSFLARPAGRRTSPCQTLPTASVAGRLSAVWDRRWASALRLPATSMVMDYRTF